MPQLKTRVRAPNVHAMLETAHFRLQTLGSLRLLAPSGEEVSALVNRRHKLALLALLAITRKPMSRDRLVDMFWGDRAEERARHSLSDALSQLRGALGQSAIRARQSEVVLSERAAIRVDLLELADAASAGDWGGVVRLYDAPFLDGVHIDGSPAWEHWVLSQRQGAEQLFLRACRKETQRLEASGSWAALEDVAARWIRHDVLDATAARRHLTAVAKRVSSDPHASRYVNDAFNALTQRANGEHGQQVDPSVSACRDQLLQELRQTQVTVSPAPPPPEVESSSPPVLPSAATSVTTPLSTQSPSRPFSIPSMALRARAYRSSPRRAGSQRTVASVAIGALVFIAVGLGPARQTLLADRFETPAARAQRLVDRARGGSAAQVSRSGAIALLEQAIALDSTNATAYRTLALLWEGDGTKRADVSAALTRAVALGDRVPAPEREAILSSYHLLVTGDYVRAAEHQRALLQWDSQDPDAWHDLGMTYQYVGDNHRAAEAYRQALAFDSSSASTWSNLVDAQYAAGDEAGAAQTLDAMALAIPGHPSVFSASARFLAASGALPEAEQQARSYLAATVTRPRSQGIGDMLLSRILWTQGRLDEGDAAARRGIERQMEVGDSIMALREALALASIAIWLRHDSARARRITTDALARFPLQFMAASDRPYLELATIQALVGEIGAAARTLDSYTDSVPEFVRRRTPGTEALARGTLAWQSGRLGEAVVLLRDAATADCPACGLAELADVYASMGRSEAAVAAGRRFLTVPTLRRTDLLDALHRRRLEPQRAPATD